MLLAALLASSLAPPSQAHPAVQAHPLSSAAVTQQSSAQPGGRQTIEHLRFRGTSRFEAASFSAAASSAPKLLGDEARSMPAVVKPLLKKVGLRSFAAAAATLTAPNPNGLRVVAPDRNFAGANGLTQLDQRNAGAGVYANTQFSTEPPDQGLCVGDGYVMESINDALAVYTSSGQPVAGPVPLPQFFSIAPEINRTTGLRGPFTFDVRCYFDPETRHWFVTQGEEDLDPVTGKPTGPTSVLVAVSQTSSPIGFYNQFAIDTTDASDPNCPCFGDQPLIGADRYGFYVSTNEFPVAATGFNGSQVYAMSKSALEQGVTPPIVHINVGLTVPTPLQDVGALWFSLQPSFSPRGGLDVSHGGTEYFLSALQFGDFGPLDNRIAAWALTNTSSLNSFAPDINLQHVVITSETYGQPNPGAQQKLGPYPLGTALGQPLPLIATDDDRMNQVVYAKGRLFSGVNTLLKPGTTGVAYFVVSPAFAGGTLHASISAQGYVAVTGENIIYPSIGVNLAGDAVLAATLTGSDYFPSAVYVPIYQSGPGNVRLAAAGAFPDDGFTAYTSYGGAGIGRWGDYSAAVADPQGNIWIATEYIPNRPRTTLANWGTFVGRLVY